MSSEGERYQIELTERQRERFEAIRAECKEADPDLPAPTDEQLFSSLLDTWDAVGEGFYSGGRDGDSNRERERSVKVRLSARDMDNLKSGQEVGPFWIDVEEDDAHELALLLEKESGA